MHPVEKKPAVEVVMTVLHAGGKFDSDSYAVSGGLHGVGVSVVNALSAAVDVEIHTDGHVWRQHYARSVPGPLRKGEATKKTGSSVTFWADPEIFETTAYNLETIRRRLQEMAFLNKGLTIVLRDERNGNGRRRRGARRRGLRREGQASTSSTTRAGWRTSSRTSTRARTPSTRSWCPSPARAPATPSRSRCSGTPATPSRSTRSRTRSTPTRAAPTRRASAPR